MQVIAILLFFLAGLAFGYALGPPMMWFPVIFPLVMALAASLKDGPSGSIVLRSSLWRSQSWASFSASACHPNDGPKKRRADPTEPLSPVQGDGT